MDNVMNSKLNATTFSGADIHIKNQRREENGSNRNKTQYFSDNRDTSYNYETNEMKNTQKTN
jgi:hypothetical protein